MRQEPLTGMLSFARWSANEWVDGSTRRTCMKKIRKTANRMKTGFDVLQLSKLQGKRGGLEWRRKNMSKPIGFAARNAAAKREHRSGSIPCWRTFPCSVRSANTPVWFAIATEDWKKSKRQTLRRSAIRKTGLHCVFLFARRTAGISEHYEKQWRNPL